MRKNSIPYVFIAIMCLSLLYVYSSKMYYPPAPIDTISKKELVSKGTDALNTLVYVANSNDQDIYIIRTDSSTSVSKIIEQVANEHNWTFIEQLGSGYIFEREGEQSIVTTEMWSKKFQLVKIRADMLKD